MADTFAGFILMPIIGLRRAFAVREWTPETVTPAQVFTIACEFGVGYATLLTHLSWGVNMLARAPTIALQRVTPKALRMDILGALTPEPLIVADRHRVAPTLDAEVKTLLLLPPGTEATGEGLAFARSGDGTPLSGAEGGYLPGNRRRLGRLRPHRSNPEARALWLRWPRAIPPSRGGSG